MRIILYIIACEALVYLLFKGQILQPLRNYFIRNFTFFRFEDEHLLECKYCTSVWVGTLMAFFYIWNNFYANFCVYILVIHRCSNFIHLLFSYILDKQLDIRVNRRKNHGL